MITSFFINAGYSIGEYREAVCKVKRDSYEIYLRRGPVSFMF